MKSLTAKKVITVLMKNGFHLVRQRGSHAIFKNSSGITISVPSHSGNKPMPIGTFLAIIKQSKIAPERFRSNL